MPKPRKVFMRFIGYLLTVIALLLWHGGNIDGGMTWLLGILGLILVLFG
ncbi:MAG: hypothetical protein HYX24_07485 [Candidatus Aenigmarchaeota archaeon]|nr:hypothetical protein [Candidatus Aenigmarchaeota archaeon]